MHQWPALLHTRGPTMPMVIHLKGVEMTGKGCRGTLSDLWTPLVF